MSMADPLPDLDRVWAARAAPYGSDGPPTPLTREQRRARDVLVEEYLWLAKRIAYAYKIPDHIERDELKSWGESGLLQAVERFDVEKSDGLLHRHFVAYASQRIRGAILDGLKSPQFSWASRSTWRAVKAQRAAEDDLTQAMGRTPTKAELAEHLGVKQADLLYLQQQIPIGATNEGEEHGLDNLAGSDVPDQEAGLANLGSRVASCLGRLDREHQVVIHEVVLGKKSLKVTAKLLGVTIADVRVLREDAAVALRLQLQTA